MSDKADKKLRKKGMRGAKREKTAEKEAQNRRNLVRKSKRRSISFQRDASPSLRGQAEAMQGDTPNDPPSQQSIEMSIATMKLAPHVSGQQRARLIQLIRAEIRRQTTGVMVEQAGGPGRGHVATTQDLPRTKRRRPTWRIFK
jgi:hypothetical protein